MTVLVVGSIALDTVETPFGSRQDAIGGSASYFSLAASYFCDVNLVATIGSDFPEKSIDLLKERGVCLEGLQRASGKTFRWSGHYGFDLSQAETISTELNVFADFHPSLPDSYKKSPFVFLANIDPELQSSVLEQIDAPRFIGCDTMNFWIEGKRKELLETIKHINLLAVNETEARLLTTEANISKAARLIQEMGPEYVVIKRGEAGSLLFGPEKIFFAPAFPLEEIYDPTGAGDSFAGGLMGYLAAHAADDQPITEEMIQRGIVMGSVMASFNISSFSYDAMINLTEEEISARYKAFRQLVGQFKDQPLRFRE